MLLGSKPCWSSPCWGAGPFSSWPSDFHPHGNWLAQQLRRGGLLPLGHVLVEVTPVSCWCPNIALCLGDDCLPYTHSRFLLRVSTRGQSHLRRTQPRSSLHIAPKITPSLRIPGSVAELDFVLERNSREPVWMTVVLVYPESLPLYFGN